MNVFNSKKLLQNFHKISRNFCATSARRDDKIAHQEKCTNQRRKMEAWQINSYGKLNELEFFDNIRIPTIKCSKDVLVKVHASGVNPIDVAMISGYGSNFLNVTRIASDIEFPIILGREFSGIVSQTGMGLCSNLKIGDEVWGVVPFHRNGTHAEYVVSSEYCLSKKPTNISMSEASALLYAGLTAWSGIFISGNLDGLCGMLTSSTSRKSCAGKRVLVLGAAGGVGSTAVQILRAENCEVIATCATDAVPVVERLGANLIIDYTNQAHINTIIECGPYDLILDCAGKGPEYAEELNWKYRNYVTFSSPLLRNVDESGFGLGMMKNVINLIETNARSIVTSKGCIKWGYFVPAPQGISYLKNLVERKKLLPLIDSTFEFAKANEAYEKVEKGHLRGKVVINMKLEQ